MTNRIDSVASTVLMTDPAEMAASLMIQANHDNEVAERDAARDERDAATAAGELRLSEMDAAANFRLVSGLASSSMKIGSSIAGGVAAVEGPVMKKDPVGTTDAATSPSDVAAGAAPEASALPAPEVHRDTTSADTARVAGGIMDGVGTGASALFDRLAGDADAGAARAEMAADKANSRAEERRSEAADARSANEKTLEALGAVMSERRRSEEAASRA